MSCGSVSYYCIKKKHHENIMNSLLQLQVLACKNPAKQLVNSNATLYRRPKQQNKVCEWQKMCQKFITWRFNEVVAYERI